jgi:hypothetical protein
MAVLLAVGFIYLTLIAAIAANLPGKKNSRR